MDINFFVWLVIPVTIVGIIVDGLIDYRKSAMLALPVEKKEQ